MKLFFVPSYTNASINNVGIVGKPEDTKEPWLMEPYNRPNKFKKVAGSVKRAQASDNSPGYQDAHDIEGPVILSPTLGIWKECK